MNKTVRDLDVKCTIFISEEGNRHDQNMVVQLIYCTVTYRF